MPDDKNDSGLREVQHYRNVVLRYEELDAAIDRLLHANGGHWDNMSEADRERYRQLAREREKVEDEKKRLERELFMDSDD